MEFLLSCPHCGRSYARLFLPASGGLCRCGAFLTLEPAQGHPASQAAPAVEPAAFPPNDAGVPARSDSTSRPTAPDPQAVQKEEEALQEIRLLADRVSFLIVATDTPRIDVDIIRADLRRRCRELFPDKMHVYDLVYESRFLRLWQQFRAA
ncbi:MAG TPA: hypothetical protein VFE28_09350 [Candidatus Krumholzibacteria bacterium]|nr:hypothetical protein [Candidatus Krumholzibacteria bacterium]